MTQNRSDNGKNDSWSRVTAAFPFLEENGHVISIVGAGGKTTLMYFLAEHCVMCERKVLVSTTTHIQKPMDDKRRHTAENRCFGKADHVCSYDHRTAWIQDAASLKALWEKKKIPVLGLETADGKLTMPPRDILTDAIKQADLVFLEADGARQMTCKAPNKTEPVLLDESDIVIAVLGTDAVGKTIPEVCFRAELAMKRLHADAKHRLETSDLAKLLLADWGMRKGVGSREYYIVLNKCYSAGIDRAVELRNVLLQAGAHHVVMTDFANQGGERQCILQGL